MSRFRRTGGVGALFVALAAATLLCALSSPARALPLFGRKYGLQCTTCHVAAPRLNMFGMHFKQNGYRMPGAQGESPWDSTAKVFPFALIGNVAYDALTSSVKDSAGNTTRTTYAAFAQRQVEFHSAGTLGQNVTFHFDNNFAGAGGPLFSGQAFVQLDDVAKNGLMNVKAGIYDADVPYLADSRKTTLTGYLNDRVTIPASGLELNGISNTTWYAVGLINSGRDTASVRAMNPGTTSFNQLENLYGWVMKEMGPYAYSARVYLDRQNPRKMNVSASQRMQVDVSAYADRGRVILIPGYTYEKFQDQFAGLPDQDHTGMLETMILLDKTNHTVLTARYEHQYAPKSNGSPGPQDHGVGTLNLAYYINANARFGVDWAHTSDNVRGPTSDEFQAFVWVGY